jgi:hypothetical protein
MIGEECVAQAADKAAQDKAQSDFRVQFHRVSIDERYPEFSNAGQTYRTPPVSAARGADPTAAPAWRKCGIR